MSGHQPSVWERLAIALVLGVVGLHVLASVLPRLVIPAVVGVALFVIVRLVLFHTRKW